MWCECRSSSRLLKKSIKYVWENVESINVSNLTIWQIRSGDQRCCNTCRHCTLESMLLNFRTASVHALPEVRDLVGCQRIVLRQWHAHHKKFVFVHRLQQLSLLYDDADWCSLQWWDRARRWTHAKLVGCCCLDLRENEIVRIKHFLWWERNNNSLTTSRKLLLFDTQIIADNTERVETNIIMC